MRSCGLIGAVVLVVAAGAQVAAGSTDISGAGHHRRSACQRLRGHDLAPSSRVKLVRRPNEDDGTDLLGCILPRGRVRTLAISDEYATSGDGYRLRQVARSIVLLDTSSDSQYGSGRATVVSDIRTGGAYAIAGSCYELASGYCPAGSVDSSAQAAFVNTRDQAVAAVTKADSDDVTIAGFSRHGTRVDLDSGPPDQIPPGSLALNGTTATWTHGGEQRSAELP